MGTMLELKPCPFCGGRAEVFTAPASGRVTVWCANDRCGVKPFTMYTTSVKEAVEAWNRRIEK